MDCFFNTFNPRNKLKFQEPISLSNKETNSNKRKSVKEIRTAMDGTVDNRTIVNKMLLDSGTTTHMTSKLEHVIKTKEYSQMIRLDDDSTVKEKQRESDTSSGWHPLGNEKSASHQTSRWVFCLSRPW